MKKQQPPSAMPRIPRHCVVDCRRTARRVLFALSILVLLSGLMATTWVTPGAHATRALVTTGSTAPSTLAPGSPQLDCVPPPPGMVAWLPGDGTAEDISGFNNHGTLQNGATYAPGKVAQAFSLTGPSDSVIINNSASLMSSAVTVDLWVYPTAYGPRYNRLVEKGGAAASDPGGYGLEFNICPSRSAACPAEPEGIVSFLIWLEPTGFVVVDSLNPIPLNQWTHITGTFDGSTMTLYINGALQGTATASMGSTTDAVSVGSMLNLPNYNFPGLIDELEIFNRALAQTEVQSIVAADTAGKCKPPKDADGDGILDDDDNCPSVVNTDQADFDGDGQGDACDPDDDNDGVLDGADACPNTPLNTQVNAAGCPDADGDGIADTEDNCPNSANPDQADSDDDGQGDVCDFDADNDTIPDTTDNCPNLPNTDQANFDGDGQGDACDPDDDNDGVLDGTDACPNTPPSTQVNGAGCPDADGDSIADTSDNCPSVANTDQVDFDGDGQGDACDPDDDNDGVLDGTDTCPNTPPSTQVNAAGCPDADGDGIADTTDNCPSVANTDQADFDGDGQGDACDADDDNDTVPDTTDNCQFTPNTDQANNDGDGQGDVCDSDDDNDGVPDTADNCPFTANPNQENNDGDGQGDVCDSDDDNDGVADTADNCPFTANPNQENNDGDGQGDVCDPDDDNDGVIDGIDNCQFTPNADQANNDGDPMGDVCDPDDDNDGILDGPDNCDFVINPDQADFDGDGIGDACDPDDDNDGVPDNLDQCPYTPLGVQVNPFGCPVPISKDQCKNDGWRTLFRQDGTTFKNQGDCIQYVNTGK